MQLHVSLALGLGAVLAIAAVEDARVGPLVDVIDDVPLEPVEASRRAVVDAAAAPLTSVLARVPLLEDVARLDVLDEGVVVDRFAVRRGLRHITAPVPHTLFALIH